MNNVRMPLEVMAVRRKRNIWNALKKVLISSKSSRSTAQKFLKHCKKQCRGLLNVNYLFHRRIPLKSIYPNGATPNRVSEKNLAADPELQTLCSR